MKKFFISLLFAFIIPVAWAAVYYPAANVQYVSSVASLYDCDVRNNAPVGQGANMQYLFRTIDLCNCSSTTYGSGAYATQQWANKFAVDDMMAKALVPTFVMKIDTRKSSATNRVFSFQISAAGTFRVLWGDGSAVQVITKTNTTNTTYSHTYTTAGTYTIRLNGLATSYNTGTTTPAITFNATNPQANLVGIAGNLGKVFPILNTSSSGRPRFYRTFYNCTNLAGPIPKALFAGLNGSPATYMFQSTFEGCSNLTGAIPSGLFTGLSGAPATYMFANTFYGCTKLTGIPAGLFAGITGAPATYMFNNTFYGCTGLQGVVPNIFVGLSGAPASNMFNGTFYNCSGLTGIAQGIFGNITGTAATNMFANTFYGCTGLTGPSARNSGGTYLYSTWPSARTNQVGSMYRNATGLSDYSAIPSNWK
jgi:hypothetical protein